MSEITYLDIYYDVKEKIEQNIYKFSELLPSENSLMKAFNCSRNTVRKALRKLTIDGYVLPIHGKGVKVIYLHSLDPKFKTAFQLTLKQSTKYDCKNLNNEVLDINNVTIDEKTSKRTGLPLGQRAINILRRRLVGDKPIILEESFFLESFLPGLDINMACSSIHDFIKKELDLKIGLIKRTFKIVKATPEDKELLDLKNFNYVCRIIDSTFDSYGNLFEWTSSKFNPDYIEFETIVPVSEQDL